MPPSADKPLNGFIMRASVVRQPGLGYIYAADPKKEEEGIPHAVSFRCKDGVFTRGDANYDAHSITVVSQPELGLTAVSGEGYYSTIMVSGASFGNIFNDSAPAPERLRTGSIRSAATIDGRAYTVGLRGIAYSFDGWPRALDTHRRGPAGIVQRPGDSWFLRRGAICRRSGGGDLAFRWSGLAVLRIPCGRDTDLGQVRA